MRNKRNAERVTEAVFSMLEHATSYDNANRLAVPLREYKAVVPPSHLSRLRKAQHENSQVAGAWKVDAALTALDQHIGIKRDFASQSSQVSEGEEPFSRCLKRSVRRAS